MSLRFLPYSWNQLLYLAQRFSRGTIPDQQTEGTTSGIHRTCDPNAVRKYGLSQTTNGLATEPKTKIASLELDSSFPKGLHA